MLLRGKNPANQLRLVLYPIIYREFYISGGAGFLPSTVPTKIPRAFLRQVAVLQIICDFPASVGLYRSHARGKDQQLY